MVALTSGTATRPKVSTDRSVRVGNHPREISNLPLWKLRLSVRMSSMIIWSPSTAGLTRDIDLVDGEAVRTRFAKPGKNGALSLVIGRELVPR
jgi:hypothetical protein